jgi:hypothetical protein
MIELQEREEQQSSEEKINAERAAEAAKLSAANLEGVDSLVDDLVRPRVPWGVYPGCHARVLLYSCTGPDCCGSKCAGPAGGGPSAAGWTDMSACKGAAGRRRDPGRVRALSAAPSLADRAAQVREDPEWPRLSQVPNLLDPWGDLRDKFNVATEEFKARAGRGPRGRGAHAGYVLFGGSG